MEGPQRGLVGDHFWQTDCFLIEFPQTAFGEPLVRVQYLLDRPNETKVTVFLKGIKSALREINLDLSQSGKPLPVMQPEDGIECRDRNLGHVAPISAGLVVNVVVDELDVNISLDFGILINGNRRELRIVQRISQESIHHFRRGSVYFTFVNRVFCGHELSYLLIPDHPVNPWPAIGRDFGLLGTAAGFDTIAILEGSLSK